MQNLTKLSHILTNLEFEKYLDNIKNNPDTLHFFINTDTPYFFLLNNEITLKLIELHSQSWHFDNLLNSFSDFAKNQIIQSFLIEEIESTNSIENIHSTKHDIFYLLNNYSSSPNKKIISITNSYKLLLSKPQIDISKLEDIRNIYDELMHLSLDEKDIPDGVYFRKSSVSISDGNKDIHNGFYPEETINETMTEFLNLYNNKNIDIYERLIISHFLLETIHPFYDGNGRLGRYLISKSIFEEEGSYSSLLISTSINKNKKKYYKAFKEARSYHEHGSLNSFMEKILDILIEGIKEANDVLIKKILMTTNIKPPFELSKSEAMLYELLSEASLLSDYGVNNQEILNNCNASKRTLEYFLNKLRKNNLLMDTRIEKVVYHKLISI